LRRSIVVGYDASPGAHAALDHALGLAAAFGDRLIIGFGVAPPVRLGEESRAHRDALREEAERLTVDALERAQGTDVEVEVALVEDRPSSALVGLADDNDARMIVVGSYGERLDAAQAAAHGRAPDLGGARRLAARHSTPPNPRQVGSAP
jgi:nucleotide-binding universal stress UspA family protein